MRLKTFMIAALFATLVVCSEASAQGNPTPGRTTMVTCAHDSSQRYSCYLPSKYNAGKKWPIMYCFCPGGYGSTFVKLYKDVCERRGWIVVGSMNAKNGPGEPIEAAMDAMWKDTHARFSISSTQCYSSGFSGGSGMAFWMAEKYPKHFSGVIPMAGANTWGPGRLPKVPTYVSVYFIVGDRDAVHGIKATAKAMEAKGHKVEVNVFSGGHTPPPKEVAEAAVDWMCDVAPQRRSASDKAEKPTQLSLKKDLAKKLQTAVRKAKRGDLAGALRLAGRVLDNSDASEEEKADAKYVKEEIEKRLKELFAQTDALLKEGMPYEARKLLTDLRKALNGTDEGRKAQEKIKEIDSDEELKDDLAAGKLFAKALGYEAKGKKKYARKYFEQVVKKYADTEYAKKAKEKL
jgi:hypothetical protein